MIEELAIDYAAAQIAQVKNAYQQAQTAVQWRNTGLWRCGYSLDFQIGEQLFSVEKAQQVAAKCLSICRKFCAHKARLSRRRAN